MNQAVFFDSNPIPIKHRMKRLGIPPSDKDHLPMPPATAELEKWVDTVLPRMLEADGAA